MEPRWQPQQGTSRNRPPMWQGDEYEQARPAAGQTYQGGYTQGYPPQGGQAWQQPPQPCAAPTPSDPWSTGPVDPFEEPSEAPELRDHRSDHLYDMDDRFWQEVTAAKRMQGKRPQAVPSKAEKRTVWWVVLVVALLVVVGVAVYSAVFRVQEVTVQGTVNMAEKDVVALSGIQLGMNIFAINEEQVERNIESNRYLTFVSLKRDNPDKVSIQVRERTPAAALKHCGILYTMDSRGMVLEEYMNTELYTGLMLVDGISIHDCRVGQYLDVNSKKQLETYVEIMVEMKVMGGMSMMKELDLGDMDNLYIVSTDGFTVRLGPAEDLHRKLRAMLLTLEHLRGLGYAGGTIDVSSPVEPTYIPD